MVTKKLAEAYDNSADYVVFVLVSTFALHQLALFLSYSFVVPIVNPFPSHNKGRNYTLFLGLSVPGRSLGVPRACSCCSRVFSTLNSGLFGQVIEEFCLMYQLIQLKLDFNFFTPDFG